MFLHILLVSPVEASLELFVFQFKQERPKEPNRAQFSAIFKQVISPMVIRKIDLACGQTFCASADFQFLVKTTICVENNAHRGGVYLPKKQPLVIL
jgi:hypothetical protein